MEQNKEESLKPNSESQCKIKQQNLNKMRMNADGTDVIITCHETDYAAHKCILMATSPMFATMFRSSFKEASLGKVQMDMEPKVMERLLDFIYLDDDATVEFEDVDDVVKTMKAAHYVQLNALFRICNDNIMNFVSVTDFSLVCSIKQYDLIENLVDRFIQEHGLAILKEKHYLVYNAEEFQAFLNEMMKVLSSKDVLVTAIIEWFKDDTEKEKHALNFISGIDITELSRPAIRLCTEQDFIKKDQRLYVSYLERLVTAPERESDFVSTQPVLEEKNLIKSLKVLTYVNNVDREVCQESTFGNKDVNRESRTFAIPFALKNLHSCMFFENHLYIAYKTNSKSCVLKYDVGSNVAKMVVECLESLKHMLIFKNKLLIVTKEDEKGFDYVFANGISSHYTYKPNESLLYPFWIAVKDYVLQIGWSGNDRRMKAVNVFAKNKANQLAFIGQKCLVSLGVFERHNTVSFENRLYNFDKDQMFIYDLKNNTIECQKCGITVLPNYSFLPLYEYTKSFYVVMKTEVKHLSSFYEKTQYVLWKVGSDSFAASAVVEHKLCAYAEAVIVSVGTMY